jgi:hypothetical protein
MPGQKGRAEVGEGLAFEDAVDMYRNVRSINDVVILIMTYNLADIKSFQNLEYWLNRAIEHELISDLTSIILLGTHLDHGIFVTTNESMIEEGKKYLLDSIEDRIGIKISPDRIHSVKISNTTREGLDDLQDTVLNAFFHSFELVDYINQRKQVAEIEQKVMNQENEDSFS